jgi:hypothetical protein
LLREKGLKTNDEKSKFVEVENGSANKQNERLEIIPNNNNN